MPAEIVTIVALAQTEHDFGKKGTTFCDVLATCLRARGVEIMPYRGRYGHNFAFFRGGRCDSRQKLRDFSPYLCAETPLGFSRGFSLVPFPLRVPEKTVTIGTETEDAKARGGRAAGCSSRRVGCRFAR